ncbi:hypothetical protein HPB48_022776 [Haemaphysalis longicornis]|uniref:C2H2-type domain-containing protein n=1 Tax=Haemaphysalis longicornis TaxID=44386 RepID=A0A9J6GET0_HAELO|nr:hypothetical protein HPB48_022776 [Haemaphysalis longicornis]
MDSAIPRKNLVVSQYTSVCELHFKYDDIIRESSYVDTATGRTVTAPLTHLRLRPDAVPSKFPGLPDSNKPRRLLPILPATALTAIAVTPIDPDRVLNVKDLADYVRSKESAFWHAIENSERLIFVHIVEDGAPWIKYSVVVEADLSLALHFVKTPMTRLGTNLRVPSVASSKSVVMALLESVEKWDGQLDSNCESADEVICETIRLLLAKLSSPDSEGRTAAITFLKEQLELLTMPNNERRHYSADFMNWTFGNAFVIVTVDEICLKAYFEYKGGDGTGVALNASGVANSVFVFTVQSFTCQFKESFCTKVLRDIICGLEKIGYRVVCVVTDSSSVNREAMSHFLITSDEGDCLSTPFTSAAAESKRMLSASFVSLREAYKSLADKTLRYGHRITKNALCPSSVEREDTELAVEIFNSSLPNQQSFEETASFIEVIVKWWKIASVKSPYKQKRMADQFQEPVMPSVDDPKWQDLYKQADVLFPACDIAVTKDALSEIKDMIPILIYVTGYAVCAALKKLNCEKCRLTLAMNKALTIQVSLQHRDLAKELDQGGVVFPTMFAVNAVAHAYVVVEQLVKQPLFLNMPNQRQIVTDLTVELLVNEATSDFDTCGDGHTGEHVLRLVLWCAANVLLKKFSSVVQERSVRVHRMIRKKPAETIATGQGPAAPAELRALRVLHGRQQAAGGHYGSKHPEQALMACDKCQAQFTHRAYVLMHQAEVHYMPEEEEAPQTCSVCDLPLENRYALRDHLVEEHAPPSVYRCDMCGEGVLHHGQPLPAQARRTGSSNEAHNPKSLECPYCPKKFKSAWHCRRHVLCSHRSSRLLNSCKHCFRRYKDLLTLRYHMALSHMRELTEEEKGYYFLAYNTKCLVNMTVSHKKGRLMTKKNTLLKYFYDATTMHDHLVATHVGPSPSCPLLFTAQRAASVEPLKKRCPQCDFVTFNRRSMKVHLRRKHGEMLQCGQCPSRFAQMWELTRHRRLHHGTVGRQDCPHCPRGFVCPKAYITHVTMHQEGQGHECAICRCLFESEAMLTSHVEKHTNPDSRRCSGCLRVFTSAHHLARHQKVHSKEGPDGTMVLNCPKVKNPGQPGRNRASGEGKGQGRQFTLSCDQCHLSFKFQSSLTAHKMTAHGNSASKDGKSFTCEICQRSCTTMLALSEHIRTHTGERPYVCGECGAAFSQPGTLRDHAVRKHSRAFRHTCPLCAKGCVTKYALRKHLQNSHKATVGDQQQRGTQQPPGGGGGASG